jgi:hypothetical protein
VGGGNEDRGTSDDEVRVLSDKLGPIYEAMEKGLIEYGMPSLTSEGIDAGRVGREPVAVPHDEERRGSLPADPSIGHAERGVRLNRTTEGSKAALLNAGHFSLDGLSNMHPKLPNRNGVPNRRGWGSECKYRPVRSSNARAMRSNNVMPQRNGSCRHGLHGGRANTSNNPLVFVDAMVNMLHAS